MIRTALIGAGLLAAVEAVAAQSVQLYGGQASLPLDRVSLRALDTLNGISEDVTLDIGETARFGHLEIAAESCRVPESDPTGDAHAFLRIRDIREEAPRFAGWMFAASPALSALDHPRYDVWVLSCSNR